MLQHLIATVRRRCLHRSCAGSVAIEFALIAPILILIFFATEELAQLLDCRTRVIDGTASAADLIAQGTSIDDDGLSAMVNTIKAIIYPYSTSGNLSVAIGSIVCKTYTAGNTPACSEKALKWHWYSGSGATISTSDFSDLSNNVFTSSDAGVVMVKVTYTYESATTELLGGKVNLHWTAYSLPRQVTAITLDR